MRMSDWSSDVCSSDRIGETLDRSPRALRLGNHLDDLRQHGLIADALGPHHEAPGAVDRAAYDLVTRRLLHGHGLARHHPFVDRAASIEHLAVDRHLVARAHAQAIAMLNPLARNFLLVAAGAHPPGGLRRRIEKRSEEHTSELQSL